MAQGADYIIGGGRDLASGVIGQYFASLNPTPGTGIAGHAAPTTFDATKPYFLVHNPKDSDVLVCPMFLRLTLGTASVGNTVQLFTQVIDPGTSAGATRYSSAGTQIVPKNTNMRSQTGCKALVYAGAVLATAANAGSRTVGHTNFRSVLGVVGDVYQLSWAAPQLTDPASLITTGTAVSHVNFAYPPVAIGPGQSFLVHQWGTSQSGAPTFEFEFGHIEVPL